MFRPNPKFAEEMRQDEGVRAQLADKATAVARRVRSHNFMRRKGARPIEVDDSGEKVRLVNTDHGGHLEEWGSSKSPPLAPLRTGVRASGLRLDESSE